MSYTKGPWRVHGGPGRLHHHLAVIDSIPDVDGKVIANCICHVATSNDDSDANARLIAAAPDLLEFAKRVAYRAQVFCKLQGIKPESIADYREAIEIIKQAEGGE